MFAESDSPIGWLFWHGLVLVVGGVVLFFLYHWSRRVVHHLVMGAVRAHDTASTLAGVTVGEPGEERQKRFATVDDLLTTLLRIGFGTLTVLWALAVFNLWPLLAGLSIILAALTLAGQSVVLDYIMGILILTEAQYYKGDWIQAATAEGEVQEVGLRRTVLRDGDGTVHSVSNGLIRSVSNLTRVFAVLRVEVTGVPGDQIERAITVIDRVGAEMAADPVWASRLLEPATYNTVPELTSLGATLRVRGRVRPEARWAAAGELRRRLAAALAAESIQTTLDGRLMSAAPGMPPPAAGVGPPQAGA